MKIGFIGLGNMASAMIGGILTKGIRRPEELFGTDCIPESRDRVQEIYQIQITETNIDTVNEADVIFLSVKPQFYEEVIREIKDFKAGKDFKGLLAIKVIKAFKAGRDFKVFREIKVFKEIKAGKEIKAFKEGKAFKG